MDEREIAIHERAYAIWEQEGRPANQSLAHWLQAESNLQMTLANTPAPAPRPGRNPRLSRQTLPDKGRAQERPRTFALAEITKIITQRG